MPKLGIIGNGKLANILIDAENKGLLPDYEIVGVLGRSREKTESAAKKAKCKACFTIEELLSEKPEYIAEAASVKAIQDYSVEILNKGISLVVLSIGAYADRKLYDDSIAAAKKTGARIYLASGAIGGFDVLRTVSLMGDVSVSFHTDKEPAALRNTPLFKEGLLSLEEKEEVFSGTATDAIKLMPTHVNVSVAAALSSVGPDEEKYSMDAVPRFIGDRHVITAETKGIKAVMDIYSDTSEIAGWSLVAALRNITSPVVFE